MTKRIISDANDETIRRPLPTDAPRLITIAAPPSVEKQADLSFREVKKPAPHVESSPYIKNQSAELLRNQLAQSFPIDSKPRRNLGTIEKAFEMASTNPLVSSASPLLWLVSRLNECTPPEDLGEFRARVIEGLANFETTAMTLDIPRRLIGISRYALCATIDDVILSMRWGGDSGWANNSLVGDLYNETWGGERFYELLQQVTQDPEQNINVLELMAICLSVGFSGMYRVMEGGTGDLLRLRHNLFTVIQRVRGPHKDSIAPDWKAVTEPHRRPPGTIALWVTGVALLILLVFFWFFSSITLQSSVERTSQQISALVPAIPLIIEQPVIPPIPAPRKAKGNRVKIETPTETVVSALKKEEKKGLLELVENNGVTIIRMPSTLFPSGGADLAEQQVRLLANIGEELSTLPGRITVIGYSDNIPMGPNSLFSSNLKLSTARASSVAQVLIDHVKDPARVTFQGKGAEDPIASNKTAEGRARNRRVEIQIPVQN